MVSKLPGKETLVSLPTGYRKNYVCTDLFYEFIFFFIDYLKKKANYLIV